MRKGGEVLLSGVRDVETFVRRIRRCTREGLSPPEKTDIHAARSGPVLKTWHGFYAMATKVQCEPSPGYTDHQDLPRPLQINGPAK